MNPETQETALEIALQAYLRCQIDQFGYALADSAELTPIALGDGLYACLNADTAAYWIAQDHQGGKEHWLVERVPGGDGRYRGDTNRFRFYDPNKNAAPCGQALVFERGFVR